MGYFQVRYDSRVVIYEHKMFIRLDTAFSLIRFDGLSGKIALGLFYESYLITCFRF